MSENAVLLIGTTKGAFLAQANGSNSDWALSGPHCDGWPINHMIADPNGETIWAGGGGDWNGAGVWRSQDAGKTWAATRLTTGALDEWAAQDSDFATSIGWTDTPLPFADAFSQIWSLCYVHGKLYAGTKPAGLLQSQDNGETWSQITALARHPSAQDWQPGGAGLVLHTIVADPANADKLWIGISAAGVFATEDGGTTWERRNRLSNAGYCGDHDHPAGPKGGETGQCVHHIERAPGSEDLLYQQNHHGVWRSSDGGRSWDDINSGLPSTFGFPLQIHPRDPRTLWTLPLNGDSAGRYPPDAAAAVWRSRDGGESWHACRNGLPQSGCFFTVLRQAMAADSATPAGVYFGTNSGSVFASFDEGDHWHEIIRHLPTILSVEVTSARR